MMKNTILLPFIPLLFSAVSIMAMQNGDGSKSPTGCESPRLRHLSRKEQEKLIAARGQGLIKESRSPESRKRTRETIKANLLKPFKQKRSPSPSKSSSNKF